MSKINALNGLRAFKDALSFVKELTDDEVTGSPREGGYTPWEDNPAEAGKLEEWQANIDNLSTDYDPTAEGGPVDFFNTNFVQPAANLIGSFTRTGNRAVDSAIDAVKDVVGITSNNTQKSITAASKAYEIGKRALKMAGSNARMISSFRSSLSHQNRAIRKMDDELEEEFGEKNLVQRAVLNGSQGIVGNRAYNVQTSDTAKEMFGLFADEDSFLVQASTLVPAVGTTVVPVIGAGFDETTLQNASLAIQAKIDELRADIVAQQSTLTVAGSEDIIEATEAYLKCIERDLIVVLSQYLPSRFASTKEMIIEVLVKYAGGNKDLIERFLPYK